MVRVVMARAEVASAVVARAAVVRTAAARAAVAAGRALHGQRWARRQMRRCEVVVRAAELRVAAGSAVAWVANWRAGDAGGGL